MTSFPPPARICANQLSCVASDELVSDSAKFSITSRNPGIDPVVMALTRGIVMVGEVACAVNGIACPPVIKLPAQCFNIVSRAWENTIHTSG